MNGIIRRSDGSPEQDAAIWPDKAVRLAALPVEAWKREIGDSDGQLAGRFIEDLAETLLAKGVLTLADLPAATRAAIVARRAVRARRP